MSSVPASRIRQPSTADVKTDGEYVLYWMIANRRTAWNFSLQRAIEWARRLKKPLIVLEALRADYRWASDRLHYFIIQGMAENARRLARKNVAYYPYLEQERGDGRGLLAELAKRACLVVSDDFPSFFLPRMVSAAAARIPCHFELIDSNGLLPMRTVDKVFARAYDFRRYLQKNLLPYLSELPEADPLAGVRIPKTLQLPTEVTDRWPLSDVKAMAENVDSLRALPIDHSVAVASLAGGSAAAETRLRDFIEHKLTDYEERNEPERDVASGLSPYLHFGHVSAHQVFSECVASENWNEGQVAEKANGSSSGWWGASPALESFLDELITWRELGYNMCWQREDYDRYDSLPEWAQKTLRDHERDPREYVYSLEEFETAETHDELWNAAQRQLVREGRIHNYLRMVWGKKILEWSAQLRRKRWRSMIELNNKYALGWSQSEQLTVASSGCLGRYDRAWGPERPIFGKIRYMSSANTARKVKVKGFLRRYAADGTD